MTRKRDMRELDNAALGWGFVIGILAGGIGALFRPVRVHISRAQLEITGQNLREKLEGIVPRDTVAASIAEGKAAAHRRRAELSVDR
jgi:hypothetical protein